MVKRKGIGIVIGAVLIGLGLVAALFLFPSEERRIRKQFDLLSQWASKEPGEGPIDAARKLRKIVALFAETCEIRIPVESLSGRFGPEELSAYLARGRSFFSTLRLRFSDVKIEFLDAHHATVSLTARLTGQWTSGEPMDESHELESRLQKIGKRWFFTSFVKVEVLKR